jgi:hypothetical protein
VSLDLEYLGSIYAVSVTLLYHHHHRHILEEHTDGYLVIARRKLCLTIVIKVFRGKLSLESE